MGVISLDRAFYIGYPLRYKLLVTANKAKCIIACTWIVSLVVNTVPAYYNNWKSCGDCNLFKVMPPMYQICVQIGMIVVVCIITATSYGFIFKIARSKHVRDRQPASSRFQADMKLVKTFLRCLDCLWFAGFLY
ncbi:hypothetical protein LOTGIDRAFT_157544 [Lottia gigantea]|uniref:G-protein coupled receptors family 1 profile domain-containing protein n=1 Tax=Lottia gigantea TaxID=225164 RepID=V4B5P4_LOTGI|nr:hypothetical protein LOTGIDRAFT_157544 [Lottia gigantea]ESP01367.1 hypothetical protein LOTGIDRAFT_157544 [Lottia gigantea]